MTTMEDYPNAAMRHLRDANQLHDLQRFANASHLYGFAAECALKAIAQRAFKPAQQRSIHGHIPAVFSELATLNKCGQDQYLSKAVARVQPFFSYWAVCQRYAPEGATAFAPKTVGEQRDGAHHACKLMRQVKGQIV
jgi:hypothetical protein